MHLQPGMAVNPLTGERQAVLELPALVAMAGIGHPPRFSRRWNSVVPGLKNVFHWPITRRWWREQVDALTTSGQSLIMTEKDAVKCRALRKKNWWYSPIDAELSGEQIEHLLKELIALVH